MDWLTEFYETYPDVPKFGFVFNSELSHDDYNVIGYADPDIESFLKGLKESGTLDNTMLIVMSDHGHRYVTFPHETKSFSYINRHDFSVKNTLDSGNSEIKNCTL